ncbi:hypothetical protein M413DRAFT_29184 [Hebeloma cylindrosporum]|uniref:Uncharacterized protein n=1 Tax=Hebeloma cylindrosporum TaxID=76867 RepID=A0A0C3BRV5_HEBCY|nr:hypothetical protein M413DRAFT_29184 [Hebeloma cylindrosporum h7]
MKSFLASINRGEETLRTREERGFAGRVLLQTAFIGAMGKPAAWVVLGEFRYWETVSLWCAFIIATSIAFVLHPSQPSLVVSPTHDGLLLC